MPETKKYLNRDGLEEYNSLLPHSSTEIQEYVYDWLDAHPEATTTVQDDSMTTKKLADGSVTRNKLATDVAHLLGGMMLTGEVQGEILTADDAYSVAPLSMTIDGKSTQDGRPTPDNPIPIDSIEVLELPVTFAGNIEPIIANIPMQGHVLRSLPDGTHDTMTLSYLRESDRVGWAWYSRELIQAVSTIDLGTLVWNMYKISGNRIFRAPNVTPSRPALCTALNVVTNVPSTMADNTINPYSVYWSANGNIVARADEYESAADFKAAMTGVILQYKLATPITTQLDPIELPVLPAPTYTVWSDPSTGLRMEYVRDSNIVIQRIEEAIADL